MLRSNLGHHENGHSMAATHHVRRDSATERNSVLAHRGNESAFFLPRCVEAILRVQMDTQAPLGSCAGRESMVFSRPFPVVLGLRYHCRSTRFQFDIYLKCFLRGGWAKNLEY